MQIGANERSRGVFLRALHGVSIRNMPNPVRIGQRALSRGSSPAPRGGTNGGGRHDRIVSLRRSTVVSPVMDPGRARAALRSADAAVPAEGIGQGISGA